MRTPTPYIASLALAVSLSSCTCADPDPQETSRVDRPSSIHTAAPTRTVIPTPPPFTIDPGYVPGMWGDLASEGGVRLLEERGLQYRVLEYQGPGSGYGNGKELDVSAGLQGWKILYTIPQYGRGVDVKAGEPVLIFVQRSTSSPTPPVATPSQ